MEKVKKMLGAGLVFFALLALFMTTYPPARQALAQTSPSATQAAHGTHVCNALTPLDPIDGVLTLGGKLPVEIMVGNFSPTPVFLTSQNGNPAAQGWPICTDPLQCASAVSLPIYGAVLSCSPAAGSVTVNIFGVR